MSNIYQGQTLTVILNTNQNLSQCLSKQIVYKTPKGTIKYVDADIVSPINKKLKIVISASDLNENGVWEFHAYVVFSDGSIGIGDSCFVTVFPFLVN